MSDATFIQLVVSEEGKMKLEASGRLRQKGRVGEIVLKMLKSSCMVYHCYYVVMCLDETVLRSIA